MSACLLQVAIVLELRACIRVGIRGRAARLFDRHLLLVDLHLRPEPRTARSPVTVNFRGTTPYVALAPRAPRAATVFVRPFVSLEFSPRSGVPRGR